MVAPLCEVRVFSRRHRYAGTLDVLGVWQGAAALIDYKTGSPHDVGAQWQTAAYHGALLEMLKAGDTPDQVAFDPVPHTYTLAGERLPSVTQVLQAAGIIDFSRVPQPILLAARDRGAAVHLACHYVNEEDLDVDAFAAEFPEYWPYLSAWITFRRESGFRIATSWDELAGLGVIKRYAVQLRKDGTYRVEPYRAVSDYPEFLTLLRAQEIVARHRGSWIEMAEVA
jgi:hypothetical protein